MSAADYKIFCDNYVQAKFKKWIGETALHTYLNMWRSLVTYLKHSHCRLIENPAEINYHFWSHNNSINKYLLWDVIMAISQTYHSIATNTRRIDMNITLFNTNEVMNYAIPILQNIYSDNIVTPLPSGLMYHPITGVKYVFDNRRVISTLEQTNNDRIVLLVTRETVNRFRTTFGYIDICIPFSNTDTYQSNQCIQSVDLTESIDLNESTESMELNESAIDSTIFDDIVEQVLGSLKDTHDTSNNIQSTDTSPILFQALPKVPGAKANIKENIKVKANNKTKVKANNKANFKYGTRQNKKRSNTNLINM